MKCELCDGDGGELIWRDEQCRVVCVEEPGYPGFCRAIWNAHVAEMTDLDESERARLMRVVFELEAGLRELLRPLGELDHVADIRQWGYMVGIELAEDVPSRRPYPPGQRIGKQIILEARRRGVLLRPLGDVIVLLPPLSTTDEELRCLVTVTTESIHAVTDRKS